MRRKERAVIEQIEIDKVIACCDVCRIAFNDECAPYIVPLNFAYERVGKQSYFYFHCAKEGRKLSLMKQNNVVGFELDTAHELIIGNKACAYTYKYQSVIGTGRMSIIENQQDKVDSLQKIMKHYSQQDHWEFEAKALDAMLILCLCVDEMSCKQHK